MVFVAEYDIGKRREMFHLVPPDNDELPNIGHVDPVQDPELGQLEDPPYDPEDEHEYPEEHEEEGNIGFIIEDVPDNIDNGDMEELNNYIVDEPNVIVADPEDDHVEELANDVVIHEDDDDDEH